MEAASGRTTATGSAGARRPPTRGRPAGPAGTPHARVVEFLTALGDVEVRADHVARAVGMADAVPVLEALRSRHLVDGDGERYRLADPSSAGPDHGPLGTTWMPGVVQQLAQVYEGATDRIASVVDDLELILVAAEWAVDAGCWSEVVRLARAVDGPLALSRQWATWEKVLHHAVEAARAGGDQVSEAWALHQLGTRALGLGDPGSACGHLRSAVALRESLGDRPGAAVSRHNLRLSELAR